MLFSDFSLTESYSYIISNQTQIHLRGKIHSSSLFTIKNGLIVNNIGNNGGIYTQTFTNSNIYNNTIAGNTANFARG